MDETYRHLAPEFAPTFVLVGSVLTSRPDGSLVTDIGVKRIGIDWGDPVLVDRNQSSSTLPRSTACFGCCLAGNRGEESELLSCRDMRARHLRGIAEIVGVRNGRIEDILVVDGRDSLD